MSAFPHYAEVTFAKPGIILNLVLLELVRDEWIDELHLAQTPKLCAASQLLRYNQVV